MPDPTTINEPNVLSYGPTYQMTPPSSAANSHLMTNGPAQELDPWEAIFRSLMEMRDLKDDWDGEGSRAPSQLLVERVLDLAVSLHRKGKPRPSRVGAGPDGTILLEWQDASSYFEIEVCEPNRAECMLVLPGQPAQHWDITGWLACC